MKIALLIIFTLIITSCGEGQKTPEEMFADSVAKFQADSIKAFKSDSAIKAENEAKYNSMFPTINYRKTTVTSTLLAEIRENYAKSAYPDAYKTLITLNRQELGHIGVGEEIVLPDTIIPDVRAYSIFPLYYHAAKDIPKLVLVSNKYQSYACYENGVQVRFAAANTGKERTPTFPGRYALTWKERVHRSSLDSTWKMPFTWNFHPHAGNAFHQFDMPGRPVSHSCVRQFMDDAEWLYKWGEGTKKDTAGKWVPFSGTPVLIIDIFDFTRKRGGPWLELASNNIKIEDLPEKPMEVEEALIPLIQIPHKTRGHYSRNPKFVYAEDTLRARGIIRAGVTLIPSVDFNKKRRDAALAKAKKKKLEEEQKKQFAPDIKTIDDTLEKDKTQPRKH